MHEASGGGRAEELDNTREGGGSRGGDGSRESGREQWSRKVSRQTSKQPDGTSGEYINSRVKEGTRSSRQWSALGSLGLTWRLALGQMRWLALAPMWEWALALDHGGHGLRLRVSSGLMLWLRFHAGCRANVFSFLSLTDHEGGPTNPQHSLYITGEHPLRTSHGQTCF